ncbi:MAG: hypothetical protein IKP66_09770 [Lachnospiraceae bacterium]|nr:hypothetical protein [Lachnospiraceae bacterium]
MDKNEFRVGLETADTNVDTDRMRSILKDSYRTLQDKLNKEGTLNLIITMEEFAELQQQVSKFIRGKDNHYELLEEVADAYLCLEYIKGICGITDEEVNKAINVKLDRQKQRNEEDTF